MNKLNAAAGPLYLKEIGQHIKKNSKEKIMDFNLYSIINDYSFSIKILIYLLNIIFN